MKNRLLPPRIAVAGALLAMNLAIFNAFRAIFFAVFRVDAAGISPRVLAEAFYLGFKFDARLAALVVLPLLLFSGFGIFDPWRSKRAHSAWITFFLAIEALLFLLFFVDFGMYGYLKTRVNAAVLTFAQNPLISARMVWESYHVVTFTLVFVLLLALYRFWLRWIFARSRAPELTPPPRRRSIAAHIALGVVLLAAIYGKFSRFPLRWSDAFFGRSSFVGQLALNPAQFFFETLREKPLNYDLEKTKKAYPLIAEYLGIDQPDPATLSLRREPQLFPRTTGNPNVVLIILESFAAFKTGALGNPMTASPSPRFDEIADQGLLFTRFYSPMEKTARSLFASLFGIPDVSVWQASVHNPLVVDQHSIVNAFDGYDKHYFIGGSANWSNIRGALAHNIDGLEIHEEGSYHSPVLDVWGIADGDLFRETNDVLRTKTDRPFFAIIQTAGNHRPFNIPKEIPGFERSRMPDASLAGSGFESADELNSFRYLDHSIGIFFDLARRERYFENTVFVLWGDHGTRRGAEHLDQGDLSLPVYHVPFVIYAPGFVKEPRRIDTPGSHVDIMPTLASFCGKPYVDQTLGIDLFDAARAGRSVAFTFTAFQEPPSLGLVDDHRYANSLPGEKTALFEPGAAKAGENISVREPAKAGEMARLAKAFYEMSRYLLYHNKPAAAPAKSGQVRQ